MSLDRVPAGKDVPNDCNVIIEIPMRGDPIKYEVDKETGAVFVDRFMSTAMHYPCNYGYIPRTLSDDGDPCDVLVLSPMPLITGVVVRCRPIGMLKMDDEAGGDSKILAVPVDKLTDLYRDVHVAARPARDHDAADRPFLRALQGSRARQVGARVDVGRRRRSEARNPRRSRALRRSATGREDLIAMTTAAHARRQLAFPLLFVLLWSTGFIAAKYGLAYAPPLTFLLYRFVLVAALMGVGRAGDARAVAGHARGSRARRRRRRGSSMASTWAACSWRSRAACRPGWPRCSSACSRSSR